MRKEVKSGMSGRCVTKDRPLGNQKAAEKGIGLEERGTVNREDVNIGGFGDVLCQATCVLRSDVFDVHHEVGQRCFQQRWQVGGWDLQKGQCGDQETEVTQNEQKG